jgi:hypothetical protein
MCCSTELKIKLGICESNLGCALFDPAGSGSIGDGSYIQSRTPAESDSLKYNRPQQSDSIGVEYFPCN